MKNMEKIARAYRLPEISTPENLACAWSCTADFGTRFLVAGYFYASEGPCYYGAVYERTDDNLSCEGKVRLVAVSEERFEDNGHALQWAMAQ